MTSRTGTRSSSNDAVSGQRHESPSAASHGFTLLELLIVLVILSTLAFLAMPALRPGRDRIALEEAAWQLASDLEAMRLSAIETGAEVELFFSKPSTGEYEIRSRPRPEREPWDFSLVDPDSPQPVDAYVRVDRRTLPGSPWLEPSAERIVFGPEGTGTAVVVGVGQAGSGHAFSVRFDASSDRVLVHDTNATLNH